ncbi:MAG TPA: diaminopimelate decarboxylase [Bryobacteraceae bacterium]|nr:diaminopimelate decarboxylase [Bryobacteraceae bacterium]
MEFQYRNEALFCENVILADIAAKVGTPCYVYSSQSILERFQAYDRAFGDIPHLVCYAVKANGNLSLLRLLAMAGSGFDVVSGGELFRVLRAGGKADRVVFSGVGKTADEIEYALSQGIFSFNCESETELALIDALAGRQNVTARVALRVNPDVDAATHPYISTGLREHKFGVDIAEAEDVYDRAKGLRNLALEGVSCHIGSQLLDTGPILEAVDKILALVDRLHARGLPIRHADLGGGLGVQYRTTEEAPAIAELVAALRQKMEGRRLHVMIEPGRSIVGQSGVLVTRVLYRKQNGAKQFVIVDAAMNDLIRPALYRSHHEIIPLRRNPTGTITADVVGPVCETGDFLARGRELANVFPGDLMAVCTAGAYGFTQASNYNARPRPAEVLVEGDSWRVIRKRETYEDMIRGE